MSDDVTHHDIGMTSLLVSTACAVILVALTLIVWVAWSVGDV
jgi:hypothetical protein